MSRMRIASLTASLVTALAFAASAHAASRTVDCLNDDGGAPDSAELQDALDQAVTGDTITVAENATCHAPFDEGGFRMPPGERITLRGLSGSTLDGDTGEGRDRILRSDSPNGSLITGLTFRNGDAGSNGFGGAIFVTGNDPVAIEHNVFRHNAASDGGAVYVQAGFLTLRQAGTDEITVRDNHFGVGEDRNVADFSGGGLYVISQSIPVDVSGNEFVQNEAHQGGGGALLNVCPSGSTVDGNTFDANRLTPREGTSVMDGGGLLMSRIFCSFGGPEARASRAEFDFDTTQTGNRFLGNRIESSGASARGAAEAIDVVDVQSTNDRFAGNRITAETAEAELEGAGLGIENGGFAVFEGRNLVAVDNRIESGGEGGGIYFGRLSELRLFDSTVVGNQAGEGGGIAGGCADTLKLYNGIVYGNVGDDGARSDITGFETDECQLEGLRAASRAEGDQLDVRASDACTDGGDPYPGDARNLCADPKLSTNAQGKVDQTSGSPTLDAGDGSLVPGDLGKDYAGDPRVAGKAVDIGADEFVPKTTQPGTTTTASGGQPASQPSRGAVLGTTQKRCVSRRGFRIRIRVPHGKKALSAVVRVDGKRVKVVRGKRLTAPVRLRGLPKGTFKVKITVRLRGGKRISGTRKYHTCVPRRADDGPPPV
jgi:hypothetical protein